MKTILTGLFAFAFSLISFSQAPQSFSYQAVARDAAGLGIANQNIGLRISILQGSVTGTSVYTETHTALTDPNGVLNLAIGTGTVTTGTFASINWGDGTYFVKIEMDVTGGTNYVLMGTSQLLSVPYALYAGGINLSKNNRQMDLYIGEDGGLYTLPKISIEKPYSQTPSVTDIDGNIYSTVKIGTQVWMAENLRTTNLNDGTPIPNVIENTDWSNLTSPAKCSYNNTGNIDTIKMYGLYYNGYTVETNKLCPTGWHVPTKADFQTLMSYLGPLGGNRLKSNLHWSTTYNAINDSGFDAYETGNRTIYAFYLQGAGAIWRSSTITTNNIYGNTMTCLLFGYNQLGINNYFDMVEKDYADGLPIRCIKN